LHNINDNSCCSVEASVSDFETYVPGSTLTEGLRFRMERHLELKCYGTPIMSGGKCVRMVGNHANSNPVISDEKWEIQI